MKYIQKNSQPVELHRYRRQLGASYAGLRKKIALYRKVKESLLQEQGYICCYCGRRILGGADSQIEHLFAKGIPQYKNMQLDYETNLLACCDGGKGARSTGLIRKEDIYCEASKGNAILPISPLVPDCENRFIFDEDGEVLGLDKDAEATIKILNLNSPVIKTMRKYAIDNYKLFPVTDWEAEQQRLRVKDQDGKFEEFCFVLELYIEFFHK